MKKSILISFALFVVVKANFFAAAARGIEPIILSVGTIFAAKKAKEKLPPIRLGDWDRD